MLCLFDRIFVDFLFRRPLAVFLGKTFTSSQIAVTTAPGGDNTGVECGDLALKFCVTQCGEGYVKKCVCPGNAIVLPFRALLEPLLVV